MNYETIRYEVEDGAAILTLVRPDKMNAVNGAMIREIIDVCDRVDRDDDVRALIITGEGRGFCSGADLSRGTSSFVDPNAPKPNAAGEVDYSDLGTRDGGGRLTLRLFKLLKPVIGAINGPAAGLGVTMSLAMDIRLASNTARFGFVFARRGVSPEACSAFFLPRIVGISRALEWCYRSQMVEAEEALAAGLIRSIHAPDDLMPAARKLAKEIAVNSAPVSVALIRQMMWRGVGMSHPMEAHRVDSRVFYSRSHGADVAEGVNAWMERRLPEFPDKVSTDMPDFFPWWDEPEYR